MVASRYEVTIKGEPGEVIRAAFDDVDVGCGPGVTVLAGELDAAALHSLLARIGDLGLELIAVQQVAVRR